jgi:hypothetical protein
MKPIRLKIKNIGLIEDTEIEINKSLLLFFGDIRQGKTTILNCVRWVLGASSWPEDIIRHGADEASIDFEFDTGVVSRSWYRSTSGKNKGKTQARETTFIRDGRPVDRPASELARLVNPFVVDHEYLKKMTEAQRKQYFVDTFPVDTKDLDTEAFNAQREAEQLRAEVKAYGVIDLTPVPESNALELRAKLTEAQEAHADGLRKLQASLKEYESIYNDECKEVDLVNEQSREQNTRHNSAKAEVARIKAQIAELSRKLDEEEGVLRANPMITFKPKPPIPEGLVKTREAVMSWVGTTPEIQALEKQLMEASGNEVRRQRYEENKVKAADKEKKDMKVRMLEARQRDIKKERVTRLAKCASTIDGLSFNEEGEFTFEGTSAGMLSTSQIMRLSERLSAMYPEGFGISLIDRAESMGKSIFEFVDRAKEEHKTILATIVGEAPAKAPAEVGVFVVEQGKVSAKQTELI